MACEKIFEDLKKRNLTKVALISGTDAFGKSMRDQCMTVTGKYGIEVLHEETYGPRDSDMTPQLTNIKGKAGVQAVINPGFGQGPAIVTRNYRQLGITLPLYQSHGVGSKQFIELAGPAAEGVRLPAAALLVAEKLPDSDPQKKVVVDYKKTYEAKTGQPVSTFGGHMYDGLMILVEAMQRAKSADKAKVRDEIEKTKGFIGTGGVVNMSPTDHMGLDLSAFRMLEIKNGDWALAGAGSTCLERSVTRSVGRRRRATAPRSLRLPSAARRDERSTCPNFLQFLFSGLTVGAIYALVAVGFTLIYNASDVINFAQGEFVMLGGMVTFFAAAAGVPIPLAALLAIVVAAAVGLLLHRLAIEPARGASAVTLIIITIGASIFLRGVAAIVFDKNFHSLPAFAGAEPWQIGGAALLPQSMIVLIGAGAIVVALWAFMT